MKNEMIENLQNLLSPGDTVYTQVTHVAASGMSRNIKVMVIRDNEPQNITYWVAQAIGCKMSRNGDGLKISGCGMDMAFEVVYNLGRVLWPNGFECCGQGKCRSNDHSNGDSNYKPHLHRDGGYALINRNL